jgi:hypothetical protein
MNQQNSGFSVPTKSDGCDGGGISGRGCWGVGRSKERDGPTVTETGSGKPALRQVLQVRDSDADLIHELPSKPAACEPHQRPHTCQPRPRAASNMKISLTSRGASTQVANSDFTCLYLQGCAVWLMRSQRLSAAAMIRKGTANAYTSSLRQGHPMGLIGYGG